MLARFPIAFKPIAAFAKAASTPAPTPTPLHITVSPATVTMVAGAVRQFLATMTGDNAVQDFVWTREPEAGELTDDGEFTAPATSSTQIITITATSTQDPEVKGMATVTVLAAAAAPENPGFSRSKARTIRVKAAPLTFDGGAFWDLKDAKHPIGTIDPDATIDISFDWSEVLADITDTLAQVQFDIDGLTSVGGYYIGGIATIFVTAPVDQPRITCRITTSSTPARVEDRTVFLKIEAE